MGPTHTVQRPVFRSQQVRRLGPLFGCATSALGAIGADLQVFLRTECQGDAAKWSLCKKQQRQQQVEQSGRCCCAGADAHTKGWPKLRCTGRRRPLWQFSWPGRRHRHRRFKLAAGGGLFLRQPLRRTHKCAAAAAAAAAVAPPPAPLCCARRRCCRRRGGCCCESNALSARCNSLSISLTSGSRDGDGDEATAARRQHNAALPVFFCSASAAAAWLLRSLLLFASVCACVSLCVPACVCVCVCVVCLPTAPLSLSALGSTVRVLSH